MNKIIYILTLLLLAACHPKKQKQESSRVIHLPYYNDPYFTPKWLTPKSPELKDFHKIGQFKLTNQLGEEITNASFNNKIYITNFFFTTCSGICPKMTEWMYTLQEKFKKDADILLLSHSVTPNFDTPQRLLAYAKNKNIDSNKWHLVTGDRNLIYELGRKHYFAEEDLGVKKTNDEFLHTENILLIDRKGHIRGIYNGIKKRSIKQLIVDIETLKKEH